MFYILVTFLDTTAQERREAGKMLVLYKELESRDLMPPPEGNQSDCALLVQKWDLWAKVKLGSSLGRMVFGSLA